MHNLSAYPHNNNVMNLLAIETECKFNRLVFFATRLAVHKAGMDGNNHVTIAMTQIVWIHGVAVDPINKQIYWAHHGE